MTTPKIGATPREQPAPERDDLKRSGGKAAPLRVTVTRAQQAALQARADAQGCTVSELVRRFVADGLATPESAQSNHADA